MNFSDSNALDADSVSYDAAPVAEIEVDGLEYRVDVGLGSAVAISQREVGASRWVPVAQARWDGVRLRAKTLGHPIVASLERALAQAAANREGSWA
ncbi:MAG TPA: hypothetical protein VHC69_28825 [Polyangiaceae bacterium]|nr:hypothetical protein [Polyangiaceae bacterium]